jgi:hypothetical protein
LIVRGLATRIRHYNDLVGKWLLAAQARRKKLLTTKDTKITKKGSSARSEES